MNIQTMIQRRIARAGGLRELARQLALDPAYLLRVSRGDREPGNQILHAFGLERVTSYRKKKSKAIVDKRDNK